MSKDLSESRLGLELQTYSPKPQFPKDAYQKYRTLKSEGKDEEALLCLAEAFYKPEFRSKMASEKFENKAQLEALFNQTKHAHDQEDYQVAIVNHLEIKLLLNKKWQDLGKSFLRHQPETEEAVWVVLDSSSLKRI